MLKDIKYSEIHAKCKYFVLNLINFPQKIEIKIFTVSSIYDYRKYRMLVRVET